MKLLKTISSFIIVLALLFGVYAIYKNAQAPGAPSDDRGLKTYRNIKYGFEITYPNTWQIYEDTTIPVINVYKVGETQKPPFTFHSDVTAISIFPEGIGTEGIIGETASTTVVFSEPVATAFDHVLGDGTHWTTFAHFKDSMHIWNEFAFVSARVAVQDLQQKCMTGEQEIDLDECLEFGIDHDGARLVRIGTIDANDRKTQEEILRSFHFLNPQMSPQ